MIIIYKKIVQVIEIKIVNEDLKNTNTLIDFIKEKYLNILYWIGKIIYMIIKYKNIVQVIDIKIVN
jgi:hypothetical protein